MPPSTWRKSSFSDQGGSDCVEVAVGVSEVAVRDSKNAAGPTLRFPTTAWPHVTSWRRTAPMH